MYTHTVMHYGRHSRMCLLILRGACVSVCAQINRSSYQYTNVAMNTSYNTGGQVCIVRAHVFRTIRYARQTTVLPSFVYHGRAYGEK